MPQDPFTLKLGDFQLWILTEGYLGLDGGGMFGVVPRVLWERKIQPDTKNRIRLAMNALLIDAGGELILVNTGMGAKCDTAFYEAYAVERKEGLAGQMKKLGVAPQDIGLVINTHLHFDHCGGNTLRDEQGRIRPAFPRARYIVQKGEYESALPDTGRNRASYFLENFQPLVESGQMELWEGDGQVVAGLEVKVVPGHTRHMQAVKVTSQGKVLFHPSDLIPTSHHLPPAWVMAYDLFPTESMENKRKILERAAAEGWILFFEHDPSRPLGMAEIKEGRPLVRAFSQG